MRAIWLAAPALLMILTACDGRTPRPPVPARPGDQAASTVTVPVPPMAAKPAVASPACDCKPAVKAQPARASAARHAAVRSQSRATRTRAATATRREARFNAAAGGGERQTFYARRTLGDDRAYRAYDHEAWVEAPDAYDSRAHDDRASGHSYAHREYREDRRDYDRSGRDDRAYGERRAYQYDGPYSGYRGYEQRQDRAAPPPPPARDQGYADRYEERSEGYSARGGSWSRETYESRGDGYAWRQEGGSTYGDRYGPPPARPREVPTTAGRDERGFLTWAGKNPPAW